MKPSQPSSFLAARGTRLVAAAAALALLAACADTQGIRPQAQLTDAALLDFLRRLTPIWQATAYAHRLPDAADAQRLCVEWPQHFAKAAERPA